MYAYAMRRVRSEGELVQRGRYVVIHNTTYHHGLLDLKIPYYDPMKGRSRYPKGLIAHSGNCEGFYPPQALQAYAEAVVRRRGSQPLLSQR